MLDMHIVSASTQTQQMYPCPITEQKQSWIF